TTTTDYAVAPLAQNPGAVSHPAVGTTALDGDQAGTDTATCAGHPDLCDRPMFPALFLTDITADPSSQAGDWQSGGTPPPPPPRRLRPRDGAPPAPTPPQAPPPRPRPPRRRPRQERLAPRRRRCGPEWPQGRGLRRRGALERRRPRRRRRHGHGAHLPPPVH